MATIVRLDHVGDDVKIANFKFATDLENGRVVTLGAMNSESLFTATAPADVTADVMVFHSSAPINYKAEETLESQFTLLAGKHGRGYFLTEGAIITMTDDGITGTTVEGEYVIPVNAATKMTASATVGTSKLVFKVLSKSEKLEGKASTVLMVIKPQ